MSVKNGKPAAVAAEPPSPPPSGADQLFAALAGLTEADLAAIDGKIAAAEAALAAEVARRQGEIVALRQAHRLAARALGKLPPRKPGGPRKGKPADKPPAGAVASGPPPADSALARRKRIAELLGTRGPLSGGQVADELNIPVGSMGGLLNCEYFERADGGGFKLNAYGRKALLGA